MNTSRLLFICIIITCVISCEFYEPFERVSTYETTSENSSSLLLYIDNHINQTLIDSSTYSRTIVNNNLDISEPDEHNSGSYLSSRCNGGSLLVPGIDLSDKEKLTFSFWMKSFSGRFTELLSQGEIIQSTRENALIIDHNKLEFGKLPISNRDGIVVDNLFLNGDWNMITITADSINTTSSSHYKIYVNGVPTGITRESEIFFPRDSDLILFKNLFGAVDKIRLYDRILSQEEIESLFSQDNIDLQNITYNFPIKDGLEFYINFDSNPEIGAIKNYPEEYNLNFTFSRDTPNGTGFSAKFDGESEFISFPISQLSEYGGFTISFWCEFDSIANYHPIISSGSDRENEVYFAFKQVYAGNSDSIFSFNYDIQNIIGRNGWNMITISCEKINQSSLTADLKLYINGETNSNFRTSASDIAFNKGSSLRIGTNERMSNYYGGMLDNIRIYNRELEPNEITNIYTYESQ